MASEKTDAVDTLERMHIWARRSCLVNLAAVLLLGLVLLQIAGIDRDMAAWRSYTETRNLRIDQEDAGQRASLASREGALAAWKGTFERLAAEHRQDVAVREASIESWRASVTQSAAEQRAELASREKSLEKITADVRRLVDDAARRFYSQVAGAEAVEKR